MREPRVLQLLCARHTPLFGPDASTSLSPRAPPLPVLPTPPRTPILSRPRRPFHPSRSLERPPTLRAIGLLLRSPRTLPRRPDGGGPRPASRRPERHNHRRRLGPRRHGSHCEQSHAQRERRPAPNWLTRRGPSAGAPPALVVSNSDWSVVSGALFIQADAVPAPPGNAGRRSETDKRVEQDAFVRREGNAGNLPRNSTQERSVPG